MKKHKKMILTIIMTVFLIGLVMYGNTNVKAEEPTSTNYLENIGAWNYKFSSNTTAAGTVSSTSSDGFVANLTSIGVGGSDQDLAAVTYTNKFNLTYGKKYVFTADIKSSTAGNYPRNLYIGIQYNNISDSSQNAGGYGNNILSDVVTNVAVEYTPPYNSDRYINDQIVTFRLGKNGYEAATINNIQNTITVSNAKLLLYDDYVKYISNKFTYDELSKKSYSVYQSRTYDTKDGIKTYKNYAYSIGKNIPSTQTDVKPLNGKELPTISFATENINTVKTIYVNGKLASLNPATSEVTEDKALTENGWVHIPMSLLNHDYNYITVIGSTSQTAILTIKNGDVSKPKEDKIAEVKRQLALSTITNTKTKEELNTLLKNLENASTAEEISQITVPTESETLLKDAKYNALDAMKTYESADNSTEVNTIIENTKTAINQATTIESVNTIKTEAIAAIDLQKAKEAANVEIKVLENDTNSNKVKELIEKAYEDVSNATTVNEITQIVNDVKLSVYKQKKIEVALEYKKLSTGDKIENLVNNAIDSIKSETVTTTEQIDSIIDELDRAVGLLLCQENAKSQINNYKSDDNSDELNELIAKALEEIDSKTTILEVQNSLNTNLDKIKLQQAKDNGIKEINKLKDSANSDEVKRLLEEAEDAIKNSTDQTQIAELLLKYTDKIKLQQAKDQASKDLTSYIGKKPSNKVKEIYDKAIEKINSADSITNIKSILEQAKKDIKAQLEKENIHNNPLTIDNIYKYLLALLISIFGITFFTRYYLSLKK